MNFDIEYALEVLPVLLSGTVVTIAATVGGFGLALILGLPIAMLRMVPFRALAWAAQAYIEFVRGTPLLIQLFFIFYLLPAVGIRLPPLWAGIIGLGVHHSAYYAEVYRSGIEGVDKGQWEAARALNLSLPRTWIRVILPQAIPPLVPALGNYAISMFKDTALLATIIVRELMGTGLIEARQSFRYLEVFTLVAIIYFAISYPTALVIHRLETRLGTVRLAPFGQGN